MPVKKASKTKKPLKILLYGASGVGKTHFALFATPGKTLAFDMEGGTDLFEGRVDFDFWIDDQGFKTQSYRELRKCIDYLKTAQGREYKTFIIDPVTLIWTLLQQERQDYKEDRVTKQKANETDLETFTTRDWNIVKKMHKGVIDEISALPQNVILIAREKEVVEMKGGEPVKTGEFSYEGEKNTIYAVDFALRLTVDKKTKKRAVVIDKDRSGHYQTGTVIPDPTFAMFDAIVNNMADGTDSKAIKTGSEHLFDENKVDSNLIADSQKGKIQELAAAVGKTGKEISDICWANFRKQYSQLTEEQAGSLIAALQSELDKKNATEPPTSEPEPQELFPDGKITEKTMKAIHAQAAKIGMSHDELSAYTQVEYPVKSMNELAEEQGKDLLTKIKKLPQASGQ